MKRQKKTKAMTAMTDICRLGNIIVKKSGDGMHDWIRVVTADGGWRLEWRDDTMQYAWVMMLAAGSEREKKILEMWTVMAYHTTNAMPDPQYLEDVADALQRLDKRTLERRLEEEKKASEKDE